MDTDRWAVLARYRDDQLAELLALLARPAWQADAACREHPELDFHPGPYEHAAAAAAKAVCAGCLVRAECLDYALELDDRQGIWGGTSGRERRRISKQRTTRAA